MGGVQSYFSRLCDLAAASESGDRLSLFALLGLVLLWAFRLYTTWGTWGNLSIDSGHEMYVPVVLAEGKMLYRDVWFMHGPLSPYFNSYLFRIFGVHLNVLYWAGSLSALGGAFFLFFTGQRLSSRLAGWTAGSVLVIEAFHAWHFCFPLPYGFASVYGCLVSCVFLWLAVSAALSESVFWILGAGSAAAAALLLKYEFGLACYSILFLLIGLKAWRRRSSGALFVDLAATLPGIVVCTAVIHWMVSIGGFQFITEENIVSFPTTSFMRTYGRLWMDRTGLSLTPLALWEAFLRSLFFAGVIFLVWSVVWWKRRDPLSWSVRGGVLACLIAFGILHHAEGFNPLSAIFFPKDMVLYVLIAAVIGCFCYLRRPERKQALALVILFSFAGVLAARLLLHNVPGWYPIYYNGPTILAFFLLLRPIIPRSRIADRVALRCEMLISVGCLAVAASYAVELMAVPTDLETLTTDRGTVRVPRQVAENYRAAIQVMKEGAAHGQMTLSVPEDTSLYFLSETHCPTRVFQFSPGIIPPGKMTEETIRQIREQPVEYLIWSNRTYPDYGAPVFGKDFDQTIGDYLTSHYQRIGPLVPGSSLGWQTSFTLWRRKTDETVGAKPN
jgi:hypothetical protein